MRNGLWLFKFSSSLTIFQLFLTLSLYWRGSKSRGGGGRSKAIRDGEKRFKVTSGLKLQALQSRPAPAKLATWLMTKLTNLAS